MADEIISGKIYFSRVPLGGECKDLVEFLTRRAVENQIWINTGEEIKNPDVRYKYSIDDGKNNGLTDAYLCFEITDDKNTDECSHIISGIWYRDPDYVISDWGSSRIPNVENFLVQIIEHDLIEYVQLAIDLAHGYVLSEYSNRDITAQEFCKTLMLLPSHSALPIAQFNIARRERSSL